MSSFPDQDLDLAHFREFLEIIRSGSVSALNLACIHAFHCPSITDSPFRYEPGR